jgi:choice-of-anchor C domain-containing protein
MVGAALAVVASVVLAGSALAAGFTNGSFETGNYATTANYYTLAAGTANAGAMTGWTVTAGTVDWIHGYWTSEDGSYSVDMNGTPTTAVPSTVGTITQTFDTSPNSTYVVQFYLAGNPDGGPAIKTLWVSATGTAAQSYTFDTTGHTDTSMGWVQDGYSFVATSNSTTLTFAADPGNTSNNGPALDNVTMTATAVTGGQCKDGGWKTMYDGSGTLFRNQGACVSFYATSGAVPIGPAS